MFAAESCFSSLYCLLLFIREASFLYHAYPPPLSHSYDYYQSVISVLIPAFCASGLTHPSVPSFFSTLVCLLLSPHHHDQDPRPTPSRIDLPPSVSAVAAAVSEDIEVGVCGDETEWNFSLHTPPESSKRQTAVDRCLPPHVAYTEYECGPPRSQAGF